jgi:uncharacterized protein involved in outer membrane biogenesis
MKKLGYGVAGLIVLLIVAALVVPSLIDWNAYKPEIAAEAKKATGRNLDIRGNISLSVLPSPRLAIADVRLSNRSGATAPNMAEIRELRVAVKFAPLLQGKVEVASVELIGPTIELEKFADGTGNWTMTPEGTPAAAKPAPAAANPVAGTPAAPRPGNGSASGADDFRLDSFRLVDGTIVYRDRAAGTTERIEQIALEGSAVSLAGPFSLRGGLTARGLPLTLAASTGRFAERGAVPVNARVGIAGNPANLTLKGTVTDAETAPKIALRVDGEGPDLGALIAAATGGAGAGPAQPFSLGASIAASEKEVVVADLAVSLGPSKATGQLRATLGDTVKATASLRSDFVDLDALTAKRAAAAPVPASGAKPAAGPAGAAGGGAARTPAPAPPAAAIPAAAIPANVEASVDLAVTEAKFRDGRIRDVRFAVALKDGKLTLGTLSAHAPGEAQLAANGSATNARGGGVAYNGRVTMRASSLRTTLDWLQVDVSDVAADRLRRMSLDAEISGDASQVQVANIQVQLDASRMNGGVTVALRERPAFGASIGIDQLNLDAYVPPKPAKPAGGPAKPAAQPAPAASAPAGTGGPTPAPAKGPLAALDGFDANLAFRVGSLTYARTAIQGVQFDGTLVGGALTIRDASVRNLAGTSAQIKGTVAGFATIPTFKGSVAAASNDLSGLFRVAGIESPVPPERLGQMRLTSTTDASADRVSLNANLQVAEVRATIAGSASGLPAAPRFDLSVDAQHPELARLAALFGDGKAGPAMGKAGLKLKASGGLDRVSLDADADLAGGGFKLKGTVDSPADKPRLDFGFDLGHPDFVRLVRAFDPGFAPANPKLGALKLVASVKGDEKALAISDLKGNVGPTAISGTGSWRHAEPRPVLDLALASGVIPLSDFLPAAPASKPSQAKPQAPAAAPVSGATGGAGKTGSERWSRDPIDTGALGLMDANVDIGADAVLYQNFRVDRPKIVAVLKDKVLDVKQVSGKMFDGGFEMKGVLDGRDVPAMTTTVRIDKANVGKALFQAAAFDIAGGILTYGMDLQSKGRSQYDMIKALNGGGSIAVANGEVKGFDLKAVSDSLKNKKDVAGILSILGSAMGGGSSRFTQLAGTFAIKDGVMRTNDLKIAAEAGAGSAAGFVDLPNWNMDMQAEFRLTEHARAPAFRARALGAPDDPRRIFDFNEIQKWLLQEGVGGLIQKLLPGAKPSGGTSSGTSSGSSSGTSSSGSAPGTTQQEKPKEINPTDVLKGLLKGLGR